MRPSDYALAVAHLERINVLVAGLADSGASWPQIAATARVAHEAELDGLDPITAAIVADILRRDAPELAAWLEGARRPADDRLAAYAGASIFRPAVANPDRYQC